MTIHETIKTQIPEALKARDTVRLRTLRSLVTAMTNEVVAKKRMPSEFLTDEEALAVIKRSSNQRKDSIEQFTKGGRPELALPEQEELTILESYLPTQLSSDEINTIVKNKIAELGVTDKSTMGSLMGAVMKETAGRADGNTVKAAIESQLKASDTL